MNEPDFYALVRLLENLKQERDCRFALMRNQEAYLRRRYGKWELVELMWQSLTSSDADLQRTTSKEPVTNTTPSPIAPRDT